MARAKTKIKFTYKDYKSLPESETRRYELLEGELIMVPSPNVDHQRISRRLEFLLEDFVKKNKLGEVFYSPLDVHLGEDVVQPDILFVSKTRSEIITEEEIQGAPDLVIEILSPATAERDRTYKRTLYARHGAQAYWIVDPEEKSIEVLTLGKAGFESSGIYGKMKTLRSSMFPGLIINLSEVFWFNLMFALYHNATSSYGLDIMEDNQTLSDITARIIEKFDLVDNREFKKIKINEFLKETHSKIINDTRGV